jgi:NAD(P)-dependent dehydrogenase (short-subunit alcohol dehydrogenase family)
MVTSSTGIVAFTRVLVEELGDRRITDTAFHPASVDTPIIREWLEVHAAEGYPPYEEVFETALSEHTIHLIGQSAAIANMAALLLFEAGHYITGVMNNVDGGYTAE